LSGDAAIRRRWWWAILATLLWHLTALVMLAWWAPWEHLATVPPRHEPLQLVFGPETPAPESTEEEKTPREFTELPPDRADLKPDDPDYISNVDSRARDRATGDETTNLPRLEGESEAPHVGMSPDAKPVPKPNQEGSGTPESVQDAKGDSGPATSEAPPDQGTQIWKDRTTPPGGGRRGLPGDATDRAGRPAPTVAPLEHRVGPAISDLRQEEMHHPMGNVPLFGDVSMSTVAWPWAPWLQQFQRNFYRNWINFVPYAYRIGVIHGRQVVQLEIAKDGTLLDLQVLDHEGHASLEEASLANLRSFAPYGPLSEDGSFPEPTLRLQLTIIYPDF
jgi:outer membrane biosynthesis protein TonB